MTVKTPIYLDNHATTPLDPRVLEAMLPYMTQHFGNAASRNHVFGWAAKDGVEKAREQVAELIGATPKEIIWTSGATESDNLAIIGAARFNQKKGKHIVTSKLEHKAVLDSCHQLEKEGFEVTFVDVAPDGIVTREIIEAALREDTILVSVMLANNEIGTVNPVAEIGALCRERGIIFHVDAVQGLGRLPIDVSEMNVDLMALSAHKMYGPKGIGALYVRRGRPRIRIEPIIHGGGHERGMRSGTLPVHQIVGMGAAAELAKADLTNGGLEKVRALRDRLWAGLQERIPHAFLNGSWDQRLPNNLNVSFAYVEGEAMMMAIKDVAVSSGSACTSASLEPSYVLRALGVDVELAHTSIRFGVGRFNTEEEIDYVINLVSEKVSWLREMSPLWEMVQEGIDLKSIQWAAH
ncbi:MAG: IscS subfamily cysteine desulfurase [Alphaproteobacteria bacterium]|nr:IscS subfamily cysteine desulfurase [Alphaproteobacteria bacterium]MCB9792012.1 IscS subfamily cysteine desulfurase [Alphaproteobacteria bacterium]